MPQGNNDKQFAGAHEFADQLFDVFHISGEGWYWWKIVDESETGPRTGPFPTAEGAYLSAIGD